MLKFRVSQRETTVKVHHSQQKKAEKLGIHLEESGAMIRATWPMRNMSCYGVDARWAIEQMEALQRLTHLAEERGFSMGVRHSLTTPTMVHLNFDGSEWSRDAKTPAIWWNERMENPILRGDSPEPEPFEAAVAKLNPEPLEFQEDKPHTIAKVPTNGAIAHQQGFTAADCPYAEQEEGNEDFDRWNREFDEDADKVENTEKEADPQPHSVVKSKYRAIYAERGHATHCGDELAIAMNGLMHNKAGTNIEILDMICAANEVDISKYSRTTKGWQGRLRMTARNMLASKVRANGGVLKLPEQMGGELRLSKEWVGSDAD
jgi:hypothetical protein